MPKINFLPTTFDSTKAAIIEAFKNDDRSFFKDYFQNYSEGSALSHVVDLFAYMSTYFNYMTSVSANEPFITTAQIEKNVFGAAKSLGFVPHRVVAAHCEVQFKLPVDFDSKYSPDHSENITIPIYTQYRSRQNKVFTQMEEVKFMWDPTTSKWRTFKLEDGIIILDCDLTETLPTPPAGFTYEPNYFLLKQGFYEGRIYKPNGTANQQIIIERTDIDDSHDSIIISSLLPPFTKWEELTSLLDFSLMNNNLNSTYDNIVAHSTSSIWINNTNSNGIQITFGDDKFGKIPIDGDVLSIRYFVTEGVTGNGQKGFSTTSIIDFTAVGSLPAQFNGNKLTLIPDASLYPDGSTGGSDKQSAESVRTIAPFTFASQDRIVNDMDYEVHIKRQNYVTIDNVKVISGENYKPPFLGGAAVVVSKWVAEENDNIENLFLTETEKMTLQYYIQNKCVTGNDGIKFVDPEFVFVFLTGRVYYKNLAYEQASVENIFNSIVASYFNTLNQFETYYKYSRLIGDINNMPEIDHVSLTHHLFYLKKIPAAEMIDDVSISLYNSIKPSSITTFFTSDLLAPDSDDSYLKVIDNPDGVTGNKYYYSLYDDGLGNIILKEEKRDSSDVLQSTITTIIGTVDYVTGTIRLWFGSYESLIGYESLEIMNEGVGGTFCYNSIVDVLTGNNALDIDIVPLYVKFKFDVKVGDNFKSQGQLIIKKIDPIVQYIGEK